MVTPRILATSGGFVAGPVQRSARPGKMLLDALALTGATRPRVCVLETASGDDLSTYAIVYEAFNAAGCDVSELKLFPQPSADPEERLSRSDLVWVGGGSVANLLALWRLHEVDTAMRDAWEKGVILSGVSAGSLCWHVGGPTDSFGPTLRCVTNALGFLPYANGVHYDSEAQRRPLLEGLVVSGTVPEVAYATDDHVGIWYEGTDATRVVADSNSAAFIGPAAYVITRDGDGVSQRRVGVGESF
jgi:peptidase E